MGDGIWTEVYTGWCSEISTLQANGVTTLPGEGGPLILSEFVQHRDREGDITHWTLDRNRVRYTIFND